MKHLVRVSAFIEIDTDHPDFRGSPDPDDIVNKMRGESDQLAGSTEGEFTCTHVQVELVE